MANLKAAKHTIEKIVPIWNEDGKLIGLLLTANYLIRDETDPEVPKDVTWVRKERDVWNDLTAAQKTAATLFLKRAQTLASQAG